MAQIFPFGTNQVLVSRNVSLGLNECNFLSTPELTAGYDKRIQQQELATVQYNLVGEAFINHSFYAPRYEFEWNLYLSTEEVLSLIGIFQDQVEAIRTRSPDYGIILFDNRIPEIYSTQKPRPSTGQTTDLPSSLVVPAGTNFYFAKYKIQLDEPSNWRNWMYLLNDSHYFNVTLTGRELDILAQ